MFNPDRGIQGVTPLVLESDRALHNLHTVNRLRVKVSIVFSDWRHRSRQACELSSHNRRRDATTLRPVGSYGGSPRLKVMQINRECAPNDNSVSADMSLAISLAKGSFCCAAAIVLMLRVSATAGEVARGNSRV